MTTDDTAHEVADAAARLRAWFQDTSGPLVMDEADFDDVQTLLADYERRAAEPQRTVFGLRIDYVSTLREERPAGNNLADAQTARDRIAARPDVVSCTVIGWLAGEWHEIGDGRG